MANKQYSMIAVVGQTGSGKSTCCENLDQSKMIYFNLEGKDIPFNDKKLREKNRIFTLRWPDPSKVEDFEAYNTEIERLKNYIDKLIRYNKAEGSATEKPQVEKENFLERNEIEYVVFDSLSELSQFIERWCHLAYPNEKDYMKRYDKYAVKIGDLINIFKTISQYSNVIVMSHDKPIWIDGNETKQRNMKIAGAKWNGAVESKFSTVMFTHKEENENGDIEFKLRIKSSLNDTTKVPTGIQDALVKVLGLQERPRYIPNDLAIFFNALDLFHKS